MSQNTIVLLLIAAVSVGLAVVGLSAKRSIVFGVFSVVFCLLAGLGAWYAWTESAALEWVIGYAAIAAVSGMSAVRHFASRTV